VSTFVKDHRTNDPTEPMQENGDTLFRHQAFVTHFADRVSKLTLLISSRRLLYPRFGSSSLFYTHHRHNC